MNRLPKFAARNFRGVNLLVALSLLTVSGVGAWSMVRALSRPQPQQEAQASPPAAKGRGRNLALQPVALGLGRKLGQRFLKAGREVMVLKGTLTTNGDSRHVVVRRVQNEAGEQVEVHVAGQGAPLTWDAAGGVTRAGQPPDAEAAALAERIALDGSNQFVLAQLRGASYTLLARGVRADEGGGEDYAGPLYDVVRVGEPAGRGGQAPAWRLYYIDTKTSLLDKVVTEEGGERVEAVLTGWAEHAGELQPTRIVWSRGGQPFMELAVTNAAHGPKQ